MDMSLSEAIKNRRSVRKYLETPVPDEHIHAILEAAMLSPSAGNTRPWEFIVIKNREILDRICQIHPWSRAIVTAPLAIAVTARPELQYHKEDGCWPVDCGATCMSILLQAQELGYGTCWCGTYTYDDICCKVQEILNTDTTPVAVIAIGVPDEFPKQRGFYEESKVRFIL